jgi:acyl carrier protein
MEQVTDSIERQLDTFLHTRFPLARKSGIDRDTHLLERGILDSLGILDVVAFIESTFDLVIDDEELVPQNFQTLSAMSEFVRNKQLEHRKIRA